MNDSIIDEVPDKVLIKISIMLEPFLDDIDPGKVLKMIESRNISDSKSISKTDKWITTDEAAEALSCTRQTIYNMISQGRLKHRYLGNGNKSQLRILLDDVYKNEPKRKRVKSA